jgi:hypothetical protein
MDLILPKSFFVALLPSCFLAALTHARSTNRERIRDKEIGRQAIDDILKNTDELIAPNGCVQVQAAQQKACVITAAFTGAPVRDTRSAEVAQMKIFLNSLNT